MKGLTRTFVRMRCAGAIGAMALLALSIGAVRATAAEGIVNAGITLPKIYTDYINGIGAEGWRPTRLNGYREGSKELFATRWVKNTDNRIWAAKPSQSSGTFGTEIATRRSNNYRPIDVSGYNLPSGYVRFNSLWEKNTAGVAWEIHRDKTLDQMTQLANTWGAAGWRPRKIEGYIYGGGVRFVSYWEYEPGGPLQKWHSQMTTAQYSANFDNYGAQGYRLVSVDSHTFNGNVYYSGIWRKMNRNQWVRTNRAAVPFQRYSNNYWAKGYNFDVIYGVDTPGGTRYGGLWVFDAARPTNTLAEKVAKNVNGAPGVGGAYIFNETTGQTVGAHPDRVFAIASSIKIAVLYAVLRDIDLGKFTWFTAINSGAQMGSNGSNLITPNTNYTVKQLAEWMIAYSHNWATNLLIKKVGMATVNNHLAAQGLAWTRVNRYIMGTGAPSVHGNASAYEDHLEGWENTTTPREMVTLLRRIWNNNILTNTGEDRFWATMNLDSNGGKNTKGYCGSVANLYNPPIVLFNKAGNVDDFRAHRAEGGRMAFPDGQHVFYMFCVDFISDDPDDNSASETALSSAGNAIKNSGVAAAQAYY